MIDEGKPPRFPYVVALLCAACVGAAAWTWMRYSYCWSATVRDVQCAVLDGQVVGSSWPSGRYVCLRGVLQEGPGSKVHRRNGLRVYRLAAADIECDVVLPQSAEGSWERETLFVGRVRAVSIVPDGSYYLLYTTMALDATVGRWHGASVAGLVVGAMGVLVFAVYLRHWLKERRAFGEQART